MAFGDLNARELNTCYCLYSIGQRDGIEVQLMPVKQVGILPQT
jgi:hypothetical protein